MTTLTAHPDKALKGILEGNVTVVAGHYEDRIISVYAHGEMPTDKLPDEFIRIERNGSIKTRTNPIGYLYGNLAVTVYVKAQATEWSRITGSIQSLSSFMALTEQPPKASISGSVRIT